jgi:hypothetical protein
MMSSVERYIDSLSSSEQAVFFCARGLILNSAPGITEKLSYKIPFFYYMGPFCYLNPYKGGTDLGFFYGVDLSNEQGILESRDRKQVQSIPIYTLDDYYDKETAIREILQEALLVSQFRRSKKNP